MKSRWGLESYLFSPFQLFSIYALVSAALSERKRIFKFIISGFLFRNNFIYLCNFIYSTSNITFSNVDIFY